MTASKTLAIRMGFALSVLLLAGCTAVRSKPEPVDRPLLAPAALGREVEAVQVVRGAFGQQETTLRCAITVKQAEMTVVGLTALGVRIFTLTYDGRELRHEQSAGVPAQLTPQRLLADLQLVYWPFDTLRTQLREAGWELTEPSAGTRRLKRDGRMITEVHYASDDAWRGRAWLTNLQYGYTLSIDSQIP